MGNNGRPLPAWGLECLKQFGNRPPEGALSDFVHTFFSHPQVRALEEHIGYGFQDRRHLLQALCHRSFIHEQNFGLDSNERLEFLGDSLLNIMVSRELFHRYPDMSEGELSKLRGALVNTEMLARVSSVLGLPEMILLGRGEFLRRGEQGPGVWADVFESLIGAIYLDSSLETCLQCLKGILLGFDQDFFGHRHLATFDAKTKLQELSLRRHKVIPEYRSREVREEGEICFEVEVLVAGQSLGVGRGPSKKKAQKELAERVLEVLKVSEVPEGGIFDAI